MDQAPATNEGAVPQNEKIKIMNHDRSGASDALQQSGVADLEQPGSRGCIGLRGWLGGSPKKLTKGTTGAKRKLIEC